MIVQTYSVVVGALISRYMPAQADVVIFQAWAPLLMHFGDITGTLDSINTWIQHVGRAIEEHRSAAAGSELMGLGAPT